MTDAFFNECVRIIVTALEAGWHIDWSGNVIVLTMPGEAKEP